MFAFEVRYKDGIANEMIKITLIIDKIFSFITSMLIIHKI